MRKLLISIILLFGLLQLDAQSTCDNSLFESNKLYESGQIQAAIDLLEPCYMSHAISKEERFDASRLLALCYIYTKNSDKADFYVQQMLKIQPDYQKYPNIDPRELTVILNKYAVDHVLDIGLWAGVSMNQVRIIKNYSPANTNSTYTSKTGLNGGLLAEYRLNNSNSVLFIPSLSTLNYERQLDNVAGSKKVYTESITTLGLPLLYRRYFNLMQWQIHSEIGFQFSYIIRSFADMQSTNLIDETVTQSSTKTSPYRNRSLYGLNVGLGGGRELGNGTVRISINYIAFVPNLVLPERRYDNVDFILDAQYIDSDFSMNSITLNVSYQLPVLYSIRKR